MSKLKLMALADRCASVAREAGIQTYAKAAVIGGGFAAPVLAFAVDPTTPEEAIGVGKTTTLGVVAVGGVAIILVALAGVGWGVGVKFIKKLRGAA